MPILTRWGGHPHDMFCVARKKSWPFSNDWEGVPGSSRFYGVNMLGSWMTWIISFRGLRLGGQDQTP